MVKGSEPPRHRNHAHPISQPKRPPTHPRDQIKLRQLDRRHARTIPGGACQRHSPSWQDYPTRPPTHSRDLIKLRGPDNGHARTIPRGACQRHSPSWQGYPPLQKSHSMKKRPLDRERHEICYPNRPGARKRAHQRPQIPHNTPMMRPRSLALGPPRRSSPRPPSGESSAPCTSPSPSPHALVN